MYFEPYTTLDELNWIKFTSSNLRPIRLISYSQLILKILEFIVAKEVVYEFLTNFSLSRCEPGIEINRDLHKITKIHFVTSPLKSTGKLFFRYFSLLE